jgi:5-methylcytosine-specific restriction enzyme subunit McrC
VRNKLVLDTQWKPIDGARANGTGQYGLAQSDLYQMHAYGKSYLAGPSDVVLIDPKNGCLLYGVARI